MSEKQSEAFDEWFKDAADGYEPPFNEEAWNKMEAKLDGQAKRRKRPLAWWWLTDALMVGLVLYMAFGHNVGIKKENGTDKTVANILPQNTKQETKKQGVYNKKTIAPLKDGEKEIQGTLPITAGSEKPGAPDVATTKADADRIDNPVVATSKSTQENGNANKTSHFKPEANSDKVYASSSLIKKRNNTKNGAVESTKNRNNNYLLFTQKNNTAKGKPTLKTNGGVKGEEDKNNIADDNNMQPNNILPTDEQLLQSKLKQNTITAANPIDSSISANKLVPEKKLTKDSVDKVIIAKAKDSLNAASLKTAQAKKNKDKVKSDKGRLFIYAAASPEWSYIFGNKTGKTTMAYGAGIGYNFGKRWSVLAGFNITKKLYTAGGDDYKIAKGSYWDNPAITINKIEADCNVYEIPVAVRYAFVQRTQYSLYATVGVSTAIMKKEYYDYDFKRNGWPNNYKYTYTTGKSHFLSGAIFSVGYARKLNNSFSLVAEPYFKIPLQGVGEGKVKIGSVGVSVGLQYTLPKFK